MKQSPSCEANRFSARQEILPIIYNPKVHYRTLQAPATFPCPEPARSSP